MSFSFHKNKFEYKHTYSGFELRWLAPFTTPITSYSLNVSIDDYCCISAK